MCVRTPPSHALSARVALSSCWCYSISSRSPPQGSQSSPPPDGRRAAALHRAVQLLRRHAIQEQYIFREAPFQSASEATCYTGARELLLTTHMIGVSAAAVSLFSADERPPVTIAAVKSDIASLKLLRRCLLPALILFSIIPTVNPHFRLGFFY